MRKADMPKGNWYCPLCKEIVGEDDERAAAAAAAQLNGSSQVPVEATCAPPNASHSAPSGNAQWEVNPELGAGP